MPVIKTEKWAWGSETFATELEAVNAGLDGMGRRLVTEYSTDPRQGLLKYGAEISALWIRFNQITTGN